MEMEMNYDFDTTDEINHAYDEADNISSIASTTPVRRRTREMLDRYKQVDLGYRQISTGRNNSKLEYYATSYVPGASIRNAITGARYENHRVGHLSEDLHFKVSYAGHDSSQTVSVMFYDDPEQFERHFSTHLSNNSKEEWNAKYNRAYEILTSQ